MLDDADLPDVQEVEALAAAPAASSKSAAAPPHSNIQKRARKSTTRFDHQPLKQVTSKRKPGADLSATTKSQDINPRTGMPYERGPYLTKRVNVSKAAKTAEHAEEHVKMHTDLKEQLVRAKQRISELELQLTAARQDLAASKEKHEISVAHAKLEASQAMSVQLLQKYQEGLQHGARLVAGRLSNPNPFADMNNTPHSSSSWS